MRLVHPLRMPAHFTVAVACCLFLMIAPTASVAHTMAVQPDGKVVLAGRGYLGFGGLVRYNPDGSLDASFANGGVLTDRRFSAFQTLVTYPDGRIVAGAHQGGQGASDFGPMLGSYLADGAADSSFGKGGTAYFPPQGTGFSPVTLLPRADGGLLAAVNHDGVVRGFPIPGSGSADLFDRAGRYVATLGAFPVPPTLPSGPESSFSDLLDQPNGSLIAAGTSAGSATPVLARFAPGSEMPDPTFGAGKGLVSAPGYILIADQGDLVAIGSRDGQLLLARYSADGVIEAGFGDQGIATSGPLGDSTPVSVVAAAAQPDGRILVAATIDTSRRKVGVEGGCNWCAEAVLARLLPNGALDPSFGSAGVARLTVPAAGLRGLSAEDLALLPDGTILLQAETREGRYFALARFTSGGALDPSFGSGGVTITETCPGTETERQHARCPADPGVRLSTGSLAVPKPSLMFSVEPDLAWARIREVRLTLPLGFELTPHFRRYLTTKGRSGRSRPSTSDPRRLTFASLDAKRFRATLWPGALRSPEQLRGSNRRLRFRIRVRLYGSQKPISSTFIRQLG